MKSMCEGVWSSFALGCGCAAFRNTLTSCFLEVSPIQAFCAFMKSLLCKRGRLNHWPMVMNLTFILAPLRGGLSL